MTPQTAAERFAARTATRTSDARTLVERLRDLEAQVAHFMEPDQKAEIGERLRRARENSPYTQKQLAEAANVELRTYQFWEQGRGVNRRAIEAVAQKIGIPADDIWEGRDDVTQLERVEQKLDTLIQLLATGQQADADRLRDLLRGVVAAQDDTPTESTPSAPDVAGGRRR